MEFAHIAGSQIFEQQSSPGALEIVELILKNRPRLEKVLRDETVQGELLPRFLGVALSGFTLFGIATAIVISSVGVWPVLTPIKTVLAGTGDPLIRFIPRAEGLGIISAWQNGSAVRLVGAYDAGLVAACGICLPSLYFFGLLSGLRMRMTLVVTHTVRALATTAVALVGILPIYMALSMGVAIFHAPQWLAHGTLWLGLILPFIAGLWGAQTLFTGFVGLADTIPPECRYDRACFLRRLVVSWSACYTAVTPVMIFTLWEYFGRG